MHTFENLNIQKSNQKKTPNKQRLTFCLYGQRIDLTGQVDRLPDNYPEDPVLTETFNGKEKRMFRSHFPFQLSLTTTEKKPPTPTSWQPPLLIGQQVHCGGGASSHCMKPTVWCQASLAHVISIHTNTLSTHPIPITSGTPRTQHSARLTVLCSIHYMSESCIDFY